MWREWGCKETGGGEKRMEKVTEKGEQKPHIQFLCTAPLYSTKHRVVVIRIYIILIKFTDHISFLLSKTSDQLFPYLNLLKKSGKRGNLFVPFLNFINKITTTVCSSLYT